VFLDAPLELPPRPGDSLGMRCWWRHGSSTFEGWDTTLASLERAWDERGPFAGVIGFSQGAAVAFLLALLAETADRDAIARGVAAPARVMTLAARACIVSGGVEVPTSRGGRLTRHARGIEWNRGSEVRERSTQTFFTRPSGSTFDRVPFQRTDEHFFVTITRAPTTRTVPHGRV